MTDAAPTSETPEERRRLRARERAARRYRRVKTCAQYFCGEAPENVLHFLVDVGLLADDQLSNPEAIGLALTEIAKDFAAGGKKILRRENRAPTPGVEGCPDAQREDLEDDD